VLPHARQSTRTREAQSPTRLAITRLECNGTGQESQKIFLDSPGISGYYYRQVKSCWECGSLAAAFLFSGLPDLSMEECFVELL
jgi:hypothetical protein